MGCRARVAAGVAPWAFIGLGRGLVDSPRIHTWEECNAGNRGDVDGPQWLGLSQQELRRGLRAAHLQLL
jgi:hypothetical protein